MVAYSVVFALSALAALGDAAPVNQAVVFGSTEPSGAAAIETLKAYKVPYIAYSTAESLAFASLPLYAGAVANFSMIVLGAGAITFNAAQWDSLYAYQNANDVRLVSLNDVPYLGLASSYTGGAEATGVFSAFPATSIGSTDAGLPATYTTSIDSAALGTFRPAVIKNVTAVTPVLSLKSPTGGVALGAVVYNFTPTQQQLSFFYQIAAWDLVNAGSISKYTSEIWISWVSRGLYSLVPKPVIAHTAQVQTRALILSPGNSNSEEYPQMIFKSYGLDFDTVVITANNVTDAPLNLEVTANAVGRYSVIVLSQGQMIAPFPNGLYLSTLTAAQWDQIHNYQQYYGVRVVAIDDVPTAAVHAGKLTALGGATSCNAATLNISPASKNFTDPAGLKSTWSLASGDGIAGGSCNFPALVADAAAVTPVFNFANGGVAAAVINYGRNQQQMSFFLPCGSWSTTCDVMGSVWFQWATYGLYTGIRRLYFTPQIDDLFLTTDGNDENGKFFGFRATPADIQGLISWMPSLNSRLPAGSNVTIEMAFNGNGVLERFSNTTNWYINIDPDMTDTNLDWVKPLGTGKTLWPNLATINTSWAASVLATDPLYNVFSGPGALTTVTNKFLWLSHTFTHEIFNNNSYSDTTNEITFNFNLASKKYWGLDGQPFWSNRSIVTPGISGIFNGDALRAMYDFGITNCVGDSSRPKTLNTERPLWWPMTTTVANNNFAGFTVIPRQSVAIYFNTTNQAYNTQLYNNIYGTNKTFADVMDAEIKRNLRTLALLSWNPAMFHQANLRNADLPAVTINGVSGKFGLMQQWVENVFGAFAQISNWPVITLKQDDLTQKFINRRIYETAGVNVVQTVNVTAAGVVSTGFTVTAAQDCIAPVTLPPSVGKNIVSLPAGASFEQIGVDAATVWIPLKKGAAPISIVFGTPNSSYHYHYRHFH
ncbi:hypothetical protein BDR26DRAFT_834015 [Obelidium mucronatum]|nr:hypothetical protein BDR26DRAFT_834015 [Obelidium mucronatum]